MPSTGMADPLYPQTMELVPPYTQDATQDKTQDTQTHTHAQLVSNDEKSATVCLRNEDHTLGNILRWCARVRRGARRPARRPAHAHRLFFLRSCVCPANYSRTTTCSLAATACPTPSSPPSRSRCRRGRMGPTRRRCDHAASAGLRLLASWAPHPAARQAVHSSIDNLLSELDTFEQRFKVAVETKQKQAHGAVLMDT